MAYPYSYTEFSELPPDYPLTYSFTDICQVEASLSEESINSIASAINNNVITRIDLHDEEIKAILQAADGGLADIKATMIARFNQGSGICCG